MTRRELFNRLCAITTGLEQEAQRQGETVHAWVLRALVKDLDALIDAVVDAPKPQTWGWMEDEV